MKNAAPALWAAKPVCPINSIQEKSIFMTPSPFTMNERVALITGAGQGVGRECALYFAKAHARAVIVNDYVAERAEAVAAEVRALGTDAVAAPGDVTDLAAMVKIVESTAQKFGGLHVVVNNAGNAGPTADLGAFKSFWETEPDEWQRWLGTNLFGVMSVCRAAIPAMIASGKGGRLITVISEAGRTGEPHLAVYSGAKAGAAGFTRAIAKAVARYKITANCVALGTIETPGVAALLADEEANARARKLYPLREFGQPADAAAAILYLASDAGRWVTGQTYPVNGGYSFNQ
jgi:2-hydroxycyclohexanecarboxyl-CoA dehydrogenase